MLSTLLNNQRHLLCCHYYFTATSNLLTSVRTISTSQLKEYYAILNVNRNSTQKEIKESFLKLSKIYHPDNKTTGSHLKFVMLKEAFDAVKDGPPAVSNSYSHYTKSDDDNIDLSHRAHTRYREQNRNYTKNSYHRTGNPFTNDNAGDGFGGPFAKSETPWEDLKRDRAYKQRYGPRAARPLVHITLLLGALCWIFIYSSVLLIWDFNDNMKREAHHFKAKNYHEYQRYEDYLRKSDQQRQLKLERIEAVRKRKESKASNQLLDEDNGSEIHYDTLTDKSGAYNNNHTKQSVADLSLNETMPPIGSIEADQLGAKPSF